MGEHKTGRIRTRRSQQRGASVGYPHWWHFRTRAADKGGSLSSKLTAYLSVATFVGGLASDKMLAQTEPEAERPNIIDLPIQWDSNRHDLSLEYIRAHHELIWDKPETVPRMIVIHWTAAPTLQSSFNGFDPVVLPGRNNLQGAGRLNVSAHYLVDREGTIYQLMPETRFARHVIGLNYCAIGIENVGGGDQYPLTKAQFTANLALSKYLLDKYPAIRYVIGHHESPRFKEHPFYRESDPDYVTRKSDPGDDFILRLRNQIGKRAESPPEM